MSPVLAKTKKSEVAQATGKTGVGTVDTEIKGLPGGSPGLSKVPSV